MNSNTAHTTLDGTTAERPAGFLARVFSGTTYRRELADETVFLNRRVRLFLGVLFWFFLVFTVGVGFKWLAFGGAGDLGRAAAIATAIMAGITLFFGVGWLRHREPCGCTPSSIQTYEGVGTVLASIAIGCIALVVPAGVPVWNLPFTIVLVLVMRAAIVPSPAWRTAGVGLLATLAVTVPAWFYTADSASMFDRYAWIAIATWGLIFTLATAIVSRIIYGLQVSVRRAMQLGNYTLDKKIGEGGMGVVYLARHALLRRPTAVKLLRPDRMGEHSIARFEREVQQTSRLEHPNIVVIYDYGRTPDGQFYYAMEYLNGLTLGELVEREGPLPPGRVIYILAQVAHALAAAHDNGLIHRDVKPANIVLCNRGGVADLAKVVDFGLVKDIETPAEPSLSAANAITGTPLYLAPEALTDPDSIDGRADLYALGAIGYYLLTGEHVFTGRSVVEICGHHLHSPPPDPSQRLGRALPQDLVDVLLRCLAKDPEGRFGDGRRMRDALLSCRSATTWSLTEATAWWTGNVTEIRTLLDRKVTDVIAHEETLAVARTLLDENVSHAAG